MNRGKIFHLLYIILSSFTAYVILYFVEQGIGVSYVVKTLVKIALFTAIPVIYFKLVRRESLVKSLNLRNFSLKSAVLGISLGVVSFFTVIFSYFIFLNLIDLPGISAELTTKLHIGPGSFLFVGFYLTVFNSFLEEFFFRGFIFLSLYNMKFRKTAYLFSAILFAFYHIIIFKTWFALPGILLALLGLATIALVFGWINRKNNNFLNSWITHAMADVSLVLLGLRLFGII